MPVDRLSKVEGRYYLCVSLDSLTESAKATAYRRVLSESTLEDLEGYATQLLREREQMDVSLSDFADEVANPFAEGYDESEGEDVAAIVALWRAIREIKRVRAKHGGETKAKDCDLSPAAIDTLMPDLSE